jgi:hypothetical protein
MQATVTPGSSVLLVVGGEAVMRRTFGEHGRVYWSAEFALILEKHGWLDFETAGPEALAREAELARHAAVIVAWLPDDEWRPEYVEALSAYRGILLLEGPFPEPVERILGIERVGEPIGGASGPLAFADEAREFIDRRFGSSFPIGHRSGPDPSLRLAASGDPNPLELAPRASLTRQPGLGRDAYAEPLFAPLSDAAGRAAVSLVLAYRARFRRNGRFFEDPVTNGLTLLACVRCLAALSPGAVRDAVGELVSDACGPPPTLADERSALARAIWGAALAEASSALGTPELAERAGEVLTDVRREWVARSRPHPILFRWRMLLALTLSDLAAAPHRERPLGLAAAMLPPAPPGPLGVWLDLHLGERVPSVGDVARRWVRALAEAMTAADGMLPRALDGFGTAELALVVGALARSDGLPAARMLWRLLLRDAYDSRQGLFMRATALGGRIAPELGFATAPAVALGLLDAAGPITAVDAPRKLLDGHDSEQLAAWAAAPYVVQPYSGAESPLVTLRHGEQELPAIWRRGNVIASSFQLLGQLVHIHTVEPLATPFVQFRSGDAIVLEYMLIELLLGGALAERGPQSAYVAPWPWGMRYGLTIRHDVDRVLERQQFEQLLEFERTNELGVTWFWLPDRLEPDQLQTLEREPQHEIALHAVRIERKREELAAVGQADTAPIVGEAIHGSGDGWLGYASVRAAVEAGLLYTEPAPPVADRPYARFPWVDADGLVGSEKIVGVSYNISIDGLLGDKPGSEGGPGVYRQLLNHPDLNFDRLRKWVASLPTEPRVNWTCEQVARWWKATHADGGLVIGRAAGAAPTQLTLVLRGQQPIEDLELRIPCRPDEVLVVTLDEQQAEWAAFREPGHEGVRVRVPSLEVGTARTVTVRCAAPVTAWTESASATGER